MLIAALAIGLGSNESGAVPRTSLPTDAAPVHSVRCPSARAAVAYYRAHTHQRQSARGGTLADRTPIVRGRSCHWARYAVKVWRARAAAARKALERWQSEWAWELWLPDKFARVGACETGYGRRPGRWDWDSGTYVSAFGIYRPAYAQFARYLGLPTWDDPGARTPREQYLVASAIQARYGWSAWGCGGA